MSLAYFFSIAGPVFQCLTSFAAAWFNQLRKHGAYRRSRLVALLLLSLSMTAARSEPRCDQATTVAASHLRLARASWNGMNHSANDENCRAYIKQFVEAVTARQTAASCQDSVFGQRALESLDAEIQTFNERIAEQSCQ